MIQLQGSLRGIGLLPIVQLLADVRETGRLRVACGVLRGELAFDDGHLVAVTFGKERGLPALAALAVAFPEAEFEYTESPPPAERNVDLTLDELRAHLASISGRDEPRTAIPSLGRRPVSPTPGRRSAPSHPAGPSPPPTPPARTPSRPAVLRAQCRP